MLIRYSWESRDAELSGQKNFDYDANGNTTAMTDALGGVKAYTYDSRGLQLGKTDPLGHVTSYAYDTSGNLSRTTDALGTNFDRYYDAAGNVILTIDAVGGPIERRRASLYDANNRVTSQTSASGEVTRTEYDANGNVARITDPAGNVTTRAYDANDRLLSETTPASGTNSFTYGENGNRLTATDASGAVTRYGYDAANRLVTITDALNATRGVGYDLRDNPIRVVNARGKETKLDYDIHKRLTKRADPAAGAVPYQYLYRYNRLDQLDSASSPTRQITYLYYDALSRLTGDGWSSFGYDAASNLLSTTGGGSGVRYDYTYDALNRRVGMKTGGYNFEVAQGHDYFVGNAGVDGQRHTAAAPDLAGRIRPPKSCCFLRSLRLVVACLPARKYCGAQNIGALFNLNCFLRFCVIQHLASHSKKQTCLGSAV